MDRKSFLWFNIEDCGQEQIIVVNIEKGLRHFGVFGYHTYFPRSIKFTKGQIKPW